RFTQRSNFSTETPHGCIRSQTLATSSDTPGCCVPCRRHHIRRPRWLGCVQSDANHLAAGRLADQRRRVRGSYLARALSAGCSPLTTALHASLAAALGAFGLAVGANLHAHWADRKSVV